MTRIKSFLCLLVAFVGTTATMAQTTAIPDANFEQALINLGLDVGPVNGSVPTANISGITSLNVASSNISNLAGIAGFAALEVLDCQQNNLIGLNLSSNTNLRTVQCRVNNITNLNLTGLANLEILYADYNELGSYDISPFPLLTQVDLGGNGLTELDISANPLLQQVLTENNNLTTLDVSNLAGLINVVCKGNPNLSEVNATGVDFTAVLRFWAENNPSLVCITVDNPAQANAVGDLIKDAQTSFSTTCPCTGAGSGFGPTDLQASSCGITVTNMNDYIYCEARANAERYEWRYTNQSTNAVVELGSPPSQATARFSSLAFVPGVSYGVAYTVEVRARVAGVWECYGQPCTVTAPASAPTTQLSAAYCNSTLTAMNSYIYWNTVPGAQRYEVEVTDGGSFSETAYSPSNAPTGTYLSMASLSGIDYNTSYNVRVRAQVAGVWQAYGATCTVSTPAAAPTPTIAASFCGNTLGSLNQYISFTGVPGATRYQHQVETNGGGSVVGSTFSPFYAPKVTRFSMYFVNGITSSTAYDVSVRAKVNGVWGNYGSTCNITTPAAKRNWFGAEVQEDAPVLGAFPNPTVGTSTITLGADCHQVQATVRNMMGQVVGVYQLGSTSRFEVELEGAPGIYFVSVDAEQGHLGQVKLVKQ